jgi:FdhD protein
MPPATSIHQESEPKAGGAVRNILTVPVRRFRGTTCLDDQDLLAVEEPLQIRAGECDLAITMRTPGNDAELATGFLFTEGFVESAEDILNVRCRGNTAVVTLAEGIDVNREGTRRNFYMTSSCGICGKASILALEAAGCCVLPYDSPKLDASVIRSLPSKLRELQAIFNRTGGLHAAGLFSAHGSPVLLREDVGRHNAVDKLVGRALLDRQLPLHDYVLMVSGRTSFELLQKTARAGIPVLAAVGAPSSLAVKAALRFGLTLIGFLRDDRFNVYTSPGRIRESY